MFNERRQILLHNSKKIFYLNYSNLEGAEYIKVIEESIELAKDTNVGNRLVLVNVTGSVVDKEVLKTLKKLSVQASGNISKTAIYGDSGEVSAIQRLFTLAISAFSKLEIKHFTNREKALAWLTS
jgi:tRNA uridine 5-carbamoylmethylation protein Kti12